MLCSYRYYVRPQRLASSSNRPLNVPREAPSSPQPAEAPGPVIIDTPPHVAIVRQYAW